MCEREPAANATRRLVQQECCIAKDSSGCPCRGMEEQRRDLEGELFDKRLQDRSPDKQQQRGRAWQIEQSRQYEADKELY